jgi:hypothetical protein
MTVRKVIVWGLATLGAAVIGSILLTLVAGAAEPTTCSFPAAPENFQAVATMDYWTAVHHNRLICAVNRLIERSLTGGYLERACQDVAIPAATRQLVAFGLDGAVPTNNPVLAPDPIDTMNPSRVIADGVQQVDGTVATVWYFNRDTTSARTVHACVYVRRS